MGDVRERGERIRGFIIDNVSTHPRDIVRLVVKEFGISRQAAHKHLQRLVKQGSLLVTGQTRARTYRLAALDVWRKDYSMRASPAEHDVWSNDLLPSLDTFPKNVLEIWSYAFQEMFNNAVDHSEGTTITVTLHRTAANLTVAVMDDGIGIFRKIQHALGLADERHAVLELAKGKFTTDPTRHSGEGIFFTSRMLDDFEILSGGVFFSHEFHEPEDWILESAMGSGTYVKMVLSDHTSRRLQHVFDEYSTDDQYGFDRTVVPVKLARYVDEHLMSRSQAKRLLSRVDRFKVVMLDFEEVEAIGQAFADEVFRVFARQHPEMEIAAINANTQVQRMISRAKTHQEGPPAPARNA